MRTHPIALFLTLLAALALAACAAAAAPQTPPTPDAGQAPAYPPPPGLPGTSWTLTDLNGAAPLADAVPTLALDAAGQAAGSAGCNRYFGTFAEDGAAVTFGPLGSTKMACAPAVMQQETAFLQLLGNVAGFAVAGDTLTLTTDAGATLVFARA